MLNRLNRFRGHNSLNAVYKYGQKVNDGQLSLKYLQIKNEKPARIAVVVSRKVNKKAVVRNRIRRRIYEQLRLKADQKRLRADLIIVVYSDEYATVPASEISKTLDNLLNKSQVIEKK
jgi:ribonuclease P protein component